MSLWEKTKVNMNWASCNVNYKLKIFSEEKEFFNTYNELNTKQLESRYSVVLRSIIL